ncbi:VWA domain-containing protein [Zavarzinia sp.]|uniref:VWA domain-containing protein n=1 Tax=Zavarzinia sp. TaxID=2027920 RepID=UPI0035639761
MSALRRLTGAAVLGLAVAAGAGSAGADSQGRAILVLDASGSMWAQIDGRSKWDIAKDAVARLMAGWDSKIALGLTVYGHRTKGACDDIEDVVPVGPVDAAHIRDLIAKLSPKGKTPIAASLRRAAEELKYAEEKATVILVSDGMETCGEDPCAVAKELEAAGVGFTAHVVGFDIRDQATRDQLQCIADATGGKFVQAGDAGSLQSALTTVAAAAGSAPAAAPPAPPPSPPPAPAVRARTSFKAVYAPGKPVADDHLMWELFPDVPGSEGEELGDSLDYFYGATWTPGERVSPGDYILRATLGAAVVLKPVKVTAEKQEVVVDLQAGIVALSASESEGGPKLKDGLGWKIVDGQGKDHGYSYDAEPKFVLPAGAGYRITVEHGDAKGEATASVKAGETTQVSVVLAAGSVTVEARPSETEPVATEGVAWKVLPLEGEEMVAYSYDATATFRLNAGTYRIRAELGEGRAEQVVEVKPGAQQKLTFVVGIGVLKPTAIFAPGAPKPTQGLHWTVYPAAVDLSGARGEPVTDSYDLEPVLRVPAGKYYVEAQAGEAKAGVEVELGAGKAMTPQVNLNAGAIRASVTRGGIKATADVYWSVARVVDAMTGKEKQEVTSSYEAEPLWILPAGTYAVTVTSGEQTAETEVTVEAGKPTPVALSLP